MINVNQTNVTRNQSTATYEKKKVFIFDNRYIEGNIYNASEEDPIVFKPFSLVRRNTTNNHFIPAISGATLADVIGISTNDSDITVEAEGTAYINVCTKGTIDSQYLSLPSGVTLDTTVGNKKLRDVLEAIGFHFEVGVEHTKFDNL
jgi:hypothetical protein